MALKTALTTQPSSPAEPVDSDVTPAPARWRRYAGWAFTALAAAIVLCGLVMPNEFRDLTPAWFVRIPVEALLGAVILLVLPPRWRRFVAVPAGVALGLLTIMKVVDMVFITLFSRSADPVLDWTLLRNGWEFVTESYGALGGAGAAVAVALVVGAVLGMTVWASLRTSRLVVDHRRHAVRTALVLTVAWALLAVTNTEIVPGEPVAAKSAAGFTYYRALQAKKSMNDKETFAREAAVDAFAGVPDSDLLQGLRGKDVVFTFVESYGYSAVTDPRYQAEIGSVLDEGRTRLEAAGYASKSGFLSSPTAGGGSWFAHATFLSGLWIDNQQRYKTLVSSKRLTLGNAFRKGQWDTVGVMPGIIRSWPEGDFFGYDRVYGRKDLQYRGPRFGYASVPDQFALSRFHTQEYAKPGRGPLMAEIELMSSHTPWPTPPATVGWDEVGDGSALTAPDREAVPITNTARARAAYAKTIGYSLGNLISYVEKYGDDDLVLVFLGDHQPTPNVTDNSGNRDVPITIVAKDRAVIDRTAAWGWQDGLRPAPGAPVWRMSDFRDRFLTAFAR